MNEVAVHDTILEWEDMAGYAPGTQRKVLRRGEAEQPLTILLKLPPGFEMDRHTHVYNEHHYVLEGEYESLGKSYPAGSYRMIPRHTDHGPFRSENGAVVLVVWES
jgi:quercetin dioxygenase-like cupin family protein